MVLDHTRNLRPSTRLLMWGIACSHSHYREPHDWARNIAKYRKQLAATYRLMRARMGSQAMRLRLMEAGECCGSISLR